MDITKYDFSKYTITPMTKYIHKMFINSFNKEWYETYWCIDLHGTLIQSDYKKEKFIKYYDYAKEAMQLISKRNDIITILWSSTSDDDINFYNTQFKIDNIKFDKINNNDSISSKNGNFGHYDKKFYFNIILDDKAGFDPETEWEAIYNLMKIYELFNILPDKNWTTKY